MTSKLTSESVNSSFPVTNRSSPAAEALDLVSSAGVDPHLREGVRLPIPGEDRVRLVVRAGVPPRPGGPMKIKPHRLQLENNLRSLLPERTNERTNTGSISCIDADLHKQILIETLPKSVFSMKFPWKFNIANLREIPGT